MIVIATAVHLVISGWAYQGKHRGGNGMAGRAGGGRGQQERAEGNKKQAKTEKKGGRENESKTLTTAVTIWQQTHAPTMVPIMPILDDVDPWKDSPCTSMCLQGESPLRCGFPN